MVYRRNVAANRSLKTNLNKVGTCQLQVRTWFGAPSAGDRDHDGDADAVDGWLSEPEEARHYGDRNPPRGVPLAFKGGSKGYGHRAMSLGDGLVRSTDMNGDHYQAGTTSTTTIDAIERAMRVEYVGWSETIDGQPIPFKKKAAVTHNFRVIYANIKRDQLKTRSRQAVRKVLKQNPTAAFFSEADKVVKAIKNQANKKGYNVFVGHGALDQLVWVWNPSEWELISKSSKKVIDGKENESPDRGVLTISLKHRVSGETIGLVGAHLPAKRWTQPTSWRIQAWDKVWTALRKKASVAARNRDVVFWGADTNRPLWPVKALAAAKRSKGWATAVVSHVGPTYGKATYDRVGVLSPERSVKTDEKTLSITSDHKAVQVDASW